MSCEHFQEIVSAALDGEAGEDRVAELDAHLAGCQACRAYRMRQLEMDGVLSAAFAEWRRAWRAPIPAAGRPSRAGLLGLASAAAVLMTAATAASLLAGYRWGRRSARPPEAVTDVPRDVPRKGQAAPRAGDSPLPGAYWVRQGEPVPVAEGLLWDRRRGLRSARCFMSPKVHTIRLPDGTEIEWTTADREVRLVGDEP